MSKRKAEEQVPQEVEEAEEVEELDEEEEAMLAEAEAKLLEQERAKKDEKNRKAREARAAKKAKLTEAAEKVKDFTAKVAEKIKPKKEKKVKKEKKERKKLIKTPPIELVEEEAVEEQENIPTQTVVRHSPPPQKLGWFAGALASTGNVLLVSALIMALKRSGFTLASLTGDAHNVGSGGETHPSEQGSS